MPTPTPTPAPTPGPNTTGTGRFERVAHRGSPRERTENTLPGFLLAIDHGADAIELDVHATRDGEVVVHHDEAVQRRVIAQSTWRELAEIDLGDGDRIPRLRDVFETVGNRAAVYVELKGRGIEDVVIDVARTHGSRFALHSFDHDAIARVAQKAPDLARGILLDRGIPKAADQLRRAVERAQPRDVWPHWTLVNEQFMGVAHELGTRVIVWTVNSPGTAGILVSLGVNGICTDDVQILANL
ncbi:MAG TPA: glycerophosphodiester phosphodiesterase [Gemmatimonadaceae bacterium]